MANLLVIDDDNDILRLLEFTLKRAGHTVTISNNGVQGLSQAESIRPDLIICDVMMPRMTGYDFCKQARTKPNLKETPIIIFSARFQPIDKQTALDAGATDYLSKSTDPTALVSRIEELLASSRPNTPIAQGMIGVFSLRGGAGSTSLAVNLAIALTLSNKTGTTLADLALLGGHAAVMMGLRPASSVAKLVSTTEKYTLDSIEPHLVKHGTGVKLLASPPVFGDTMLPYDDRLLPLLQGIKNSYALSVLDIPHILEPKFSQILQLIDKLILVLSPDMPSVQSAVIALQGLGQMGLPNNKIIPVINQTMPENALPVNTIEKVIKRQIQIMIPFEPNMVKAVNSGKPLLLSFPQSPATSIIGRLAKTSVS